MIALSFTYLGLGRMSHKDPWPQSKEFDLSWQECHLMDLIFQMSGEDPQRIGIMVASHNEDTVKDSSKNNLTIYIFPPRFGMESVEWPSWIWTPR